MAEILFVILHFLSCTFFLSGILLCLQRSENKRPRIYLAILMFTVATEIAYRLYLAYQTRGITTVNEVLPIYVLVTGVTEILLIYLYPLEVIKPGWLTMKRLFLLFLPWLLIGGVCMLIYPNFRELSSFSDIVQYIGEFNVWFRLLIVFGCFIPYTMLLLSISYRWLQSNVDSRWIYKYAIGVQIIGLLFSTVVLTGSVSVSCIHLLYGILFFFYVVYQELFVRLYIVPHESSISIVHQLEEYVQREQAEEQPKLSCGVLPEQMPLIWMQLEEYMKIAEPWRDPNITLAILADGVKSNRTTISNLIQRAGYENFYTYIANYRIEAFCLAARERRVNNIQDTFFEIGFRNRNTALNQFKKQMGVTPSDYLRNQGY